MISTRPKSERTSPPASPPPPSNQRNMAIQELRRGTHLAEKLRRQLGLIPDVDRREAAAAKVSEVAEAMESSLTILRSESEHSSFSETGAVAVASPAGQTSSARTGGARHSFARARKVRHRRGRLGEELPIKEILTEAPENDRFHWRKYGEKKILNAEYPRLYYKCGYNDDHKCPAKKYVQQQTNSNPPQFMVTLIYEHTCETLFRNETSSSSGSSQVLDFTNASICPPLMAGTLGLKKEVETSASESSHSCEYDLSALMSPNGDQTDFVPGIRWS